MPPKCGYVQELNQKDYQEDAGSYEEPINCQQYAIDFNTLSLEKQKAFFTHLFHTMDASIKINLPYIRYEGSTAVLTAVIGKTICTSTLGDARSFACMYDENNKIIDVKQLSSKLHVTESQEELDRIRNAGGIITYDYAVRKGSALLDCVQKLPNKPAVTLKDLGFIDPECELLRATRVNGAGELNSRLNLTRAFGDFEHKTKDDQKLIIATPQVDIYDIESLLKEYKAKKIQIINVSDGVVDAFGKGDNPQLHEKCIKDILSDVKQSTDFDQTVAEHIVDGALKTGLCKDNMTALVKTVHDDIENADSNSTETIKLIGVYDGHGGSKVSAYLAANMSDQFLVYMSMIKNSESILPEFLLDMYKKYMEGAYEDANSDENQLEDIRKLNRLVYQASKSEIRKFFIDRWNKTEDKDTYAQNTPFNAALIFVASCFEEKKNSYINILMPTLPELDFSADEFTQSYANPNPISRHLSHLLDLGETINRYKSTGKLINIKTREPLNVDEIKEIETSPYAETFKNIQTVNLPEYDYKNACLPLPAYCAILDLCENTPLLIQNEQAEQVSRAIQQNFANQNSNIMSYMEKLYCKFFQYIDALPIETRNQFYATKIDHDGKIIGIKAFLEICKTKDYDSKLTISWARLLYRYNLNVAFANPALKIAIDPHTKPEVYLIKNIASNPQYDDSVISKAIRNAYNDFCIKYSAKNKPIPLYLHSEFVKFLLKQFQGKAFGILAERGSYLAQDGTTYRNIPKGLARILNTLSISNKKDDESILQSLKAYATALLKDKKKAKPYTADDIDTCYFWFRTIETRQLYANLLNADNCQQFVQLFNKAPESSPESILEKKNEQRSLTKNSF